jgi:predicted flap endonuclease-1-like 5' DNA nuclease
MEGQSTSPGEASEQMAWMTSTTLVLIAIGVVIALAIILFGIRAKRRRAAAEQTLRDDGAVTPRSLATPDPAATTPVQAAPAHAAPASPSPVSAPPLAAEPDPAPASAPPLTAGPPAAPVHAAELEEAPEPPLADEPLPAVAATQAAPASLAADLAMPPALPPQESTTDDLTRMKGVGPKLAQRLGELGITRFDQIAALSPSEADALDAQLGAFKGRLQRDRWIEQAGYLAAGDRAGFEAAFGKL